MGFLKKKKPKKSRTPVIDVSAVKVGVGSEAKYVTARSYAEIVDLISEGPIEGITSGNYIYTRNDNVTGYQKVEFEAYTATGVDPTDATQKKELGFLRSVYWNKVPVVDKNGFYNFADINVNYVKGNPTGGIPTPNDFLPNYGTIDSSDQMDLTIDRSIGERLYGPAIQGGEDDLPTDTRYAKIKGPADKYAKTYRILNKECSKIIVRVKIPNLQENLQFGEKSYKKRPAAVGFGDQKARIIRYSIFYQPIFNERFSSNKTSSDVRVDFSADEWKLAKKEEVEGKIEQGYVRSSTIDLTDKGFQDKDNFEGWRIRIVRTTPESVTSFLRNQSFVDSIVEVYGTKMRYPYTSMVYSIFDARSFQRLPSRAYDAKLLKVKVPNNYNPLLKSYGNSASYAGATKIQGIAVGAATNSNTTDGGVTWTRLNENATVEWDGNFAEDLIWTDNPAWCFYDLITNPRYGLGEFVDASQIDKWALYEIARYCDELVDDTYGGFEPRFTINYIITSREEAFKVLNDLSSIFRGLAYYSNGSIFSSQDKLKSSNYSFNNSNVIDGNFTYSSSAKRARHTVAIVRYNDKRNWYQPAVEYMEDEEHVKRYGIRELETTALGCTSRGQARRFAKWILASESEETETASFNVGMDGAYLRPGDVITIYDNHRNPLKYSGRTNAVVKGNTDLTVVNKLDGVPLTSLQRLNVNSVIIDQALNFQAGKKYKFSMLTPTYSYEQNTVETSNDVKDGVRRTQIQNLAFDGSDVINITGEPGTFRSDLRYQGSGVCTKIYFNSGIRIEDLDGVPKGNVGASPYTGNQFNFVDYVITGYSNNAVENSSAEVPYSGNYYSGQNLIWSIEPLFDNDPEFINNQESPYRIINITEEDDSSYGISSLSYSTGKYESIDSIGNSYSNTLLDLFFPLPKVGQSNLLANWVGRYPNQLFDPSSSANQTNTEVLSVKQDTPSVGLTSDPQGLVSLKSNFSVAGFQNNLNIGDDAETVTVNYPDDSSIDDKISYSYLISSTDPGITYEWNINGTRSLTSVTPQENVTYAVDKEFYKDVKQNQIKLITAEDTKYFNSPGQKSKLEVETLITDPGDYYVMVYPISDIGVIGHGLLRKVVIGGDKLSTPIDTLTISNLTTRGPDGQPIQTTASSVRGFSLDNTEPTFLWEVGSQEEIFNRPISSDYPNGFGRYEMNFDFAEDINYRVTIRKQSESDTPNLPNNYIYFEFTGYTSPSTTPAFAFDQQINNPDLIEDLSNASYSPNPNSRDITEYKNATNGDTFYKVSPSGMVIRNTQDLPLREFDIVVETQDNAGNTSNNSKVYANTIDTNISEEFNVEDFNSSYDILGVSIDSPEGVFFAQDTVSTEKATHYYSMDSVSKHNYPYKATLRLMSAGTLDLTMEEVENADGTTSTTEEQADRFSDDIQGVVYYFTTGDHTKNADGEYKNLAPEFKVNINAQRDNGSYNVKSNLNIKDRLSSVISPTANISFDGVVTVEGKGQVHRNYHIFSDADTIDGFQIPFPKITNPDVTNISLSFAFFDSLSLRRAFNIDDSDEPKQDKYNDGSDTYVNDRIFSDHTLNFSTYPSNKDLEYTIGGTQSTGPNTAFLEPLGTSIRLNEFNPTPSAASALAFASWVELNVGSTLEEAQFACGLASFEKFYDFSDDLKKARELLQGNIFTSNEEFESAVPDTVYANINMGNKYLVYHDRYKSIFKGDVIDFNNIQFVSEYGQDKYAALIYYIIVPFTRVLDPDTYSICLQPLDTSPTSLLPYSLVPQPESFIVTKYNQSAIIYIKQKFLMGAPRNQLRDAIPQRMVDRGGMKIKFGILIDE
jgi:hypothetical protein